MPRKMLESKEKIPHKIKSQARYGEWPMGFRRSDLQEAFFVPGTHAFRVYGYGTSDPLEEVLAPTPGELVVAPIAVSI
jgi:hypothetical protein